MKTLYDQCREMTPERLHAMCTVAEGGAYVVAPFMVAHNTERLLRAATAAYGPTSIAYSYKTNYHKDLVFSARAQGARSEVVSLQEYRLARSWGIADREIIFNGPGKTLEILREVVDREITIIADSIEELRRIACLRAEGVTIRATLGVRLAPALSFQKHPSRFGVDIACAESRAALLQLIRDQGLPVTGIHLHYTGDRSAASFVERLDALIAAWGGLKLGPPAFVDCGGGLASAIPEEMRSQLSYTVDSLETCGHTLGQAMKRHFPDESVQLLIEPGTGLLADAGVFITPVLDVKRIGGRSIAVVDGTYFCINPLRAAATPSVFRVPSATTPDTAVPAPVAVYGNSCMEIDLLVPAHGETLAIGDLLVFAQKGAYAACMATPFIQGIPATLCLTQDHRLSVSRPRSQPALLQALNGPSPL